MRKAQRNIYLIYDTNYDSLYPLEIIFHEEISRLLNTTNRAQNTITCEKVPNEFRRGGMGKGSRGRKRYITERGDHLSKVSS